MKKTFFAAAALGLSALFAFGATACGGNTDSNKVTVYEEIELTAETYAFAINKENKDLLTTINGYIDEMEKDGSMKTLINSYFDGTATFTYTNPANKPDNAFVVATNAYFPPFEYYEGNALSGIDIELASIFANKMGKVLYVSDMDFDAIIPSVSMNMCDIGMAGMTVNEEREKQVSFAKGYYESAQVLSVKAGDDTFKDCKTVEDVENILKAQSKDYKVGTQKGTTGFMYSAGDEDFGYDGFKNLTTKDYSTGALAMQDLVNGRINAVILDKQPSLMIAESINK